MHAATTFARKQLCWAEDSAQLTTACKQAEIMSVHQQWASPAAHTGNRGGTCTPVQTNVMHSCPNLQKGHIE